MILKRAFSTIIICGICLSSPPVQAQEWSYSLRPPALSGDTPMANALQVGAAERDITPPPGFPKAGFSSNGVVAKGVRTHVKVRAFYLKPARGRPVLLLQGDWLAGSRILREEVGKRLAVDTDIPVENILLLSTHTHAGPGQYFGSNFYNSWASSEAGFDPKWFEFMSQEATAAAREAYLSQKPGRMAVGQREVWGLSRNRSFEAFAQNPEADEKADSDTGKFRAINPILTLIRLDAKANDGTYLPLGAMSVFSIHGTAIPNDSPYINGDLWFWAEKAVERHIVSTNPALPWKPIHAPIQGTHADVAPNIHTRALGFPEAKRIGLLLGAEMVGLFDELKDAGEINPTVRAFEREVDVYEEKNRSLNGATLCDPVVGASLAGAPFEHETFILHSLPFFGPNWARSIFTTGCQGVKQHLGGPLQSMILKKESFPHVIPLVMAELGPLILLPLPFEVSVQSGRRIQRSLQNALIAVGDDPKRPVVISSVANEYMGYATTPEEYRLQYYEGGHTLLGPHTVPWLGAQLERLAQDAWSGNGFHRDPTPRVFQLQTKDFMPKTLKWFGNRTSYGKPRWVDSTPLEEGYWTWTWGDVPPGSVAWHRPLIRLQSSADNGATWQDAKWEGERLDDQSGDLGILHLGSEESGGGRYEVRWYDPPFDAKTLYRFWVEAREGLPAVWSPSFR